MEGPELFLDKYKHWVVDCLGKKHLRNMKLKQKGSTQSNKKYQQQKQIPHKENQKRNRIKGPVWHLSNGER